MKNLSNMKKHFQCHIVNNHKFSFTVFKNRGPQILFGATLINSSKLSRPKHFVSM